MMYIIILLRQVELEQRRKEGDFTDFDANLDETDMFPQDTKLFLRFVEDPGEEYQKMNKIRQDLGTVQVKIGQKWMKLVKNMENVTSILANLRPFKGY